jgi:PAS domain S-box-containing protein
MAPIATFVLLVIAAFIVWAVSSGRRTAQTLRADVARRTAMEAELRLVIDTIPAMAWVVKADGKLEVLNRRWLDYAGMTLEEAIERANETMHPEDAERVAESWRRKMPAGEPFEDEIRLRRADGEYRWFLVRTMPLRDASGAVVKWYGTSADIEDRKRAEDASRRSEQALRDSAGRLQHLSRRLLEVQEEERRHLARELHDEFGQLLASVTLHLHAARSHAGDAARAELDRCMALLERAGTRVRSLALELRPTMLETAGLDAALRWLADQHRQPGGLAVHVAGDAEGVAGDAAIVCFRVAQEALTNVVRHAGAKNVWIRLARRDGGVQLTVRDDGAGFDVDKPLGQAAGAGRLGLLGMRERVQVMGGSLEIDSDPRRGTRILALLPA